MPKVSGETYSKFITGTPLMLEFEWMVAVLCMIHDVDSLRAQIVDNELTFSTRMGMSHYLYYFYINNFPIQKNSANHLENVLKRISSPPFEVMQQRAIIALNDNLHTVPLVLLIKVIHFMLNHLLMSTSSSHPRCH